MIEFAALTYGLLTSFILSSLQANARRRQKTPAIMIAAGYFLCGMSAAISAVLFGAAASLLIWG